MRAAGLRLAGAALALVSACRQPAPAAPPKVAAEGAPAKPARSPAPPPEVAEPSEVAEQANAATPTEPVAEVPQLPVVRVALAEETTAAARCAAVVGAELWVADAPERWPLKVRSISPTGRVQDHPPMAAFANPTGGALLCAGAANRLWVARRGVAGLRNTDAKRANEFAGHAPIAGLVGQRDGGAVVVGGGQAEAALVRLTADMQPVWQNSAQLPAELTVATATLRDDVLALGRLGGGNGPWFAVRIAAKNGAILWQKPLPATIAPPRALFAALAGSAAGGVLFLESTESASQAAAAWLAVAIDANGGSAKPVRLPQRAPRMVAAGGELSTVWAQARGEGLIVEQFAGYAPWAANRAPWPGPEEPVALALAADGARWAVSLGRHADGETATVLVTRFAAGPVAAQADTAAPSLCRATFAAPSAAKQPDSAVQFADGAPCGPRASCDRGVCRPLK